MTPDDSPSSTVPEPCSFCGRPARWELAADTLVCGPECEARFAEQFCQGCGANVADGDDHAEGCEYDGASVFDEDDEPDCEAYEWDAIEVAS